MFPHSTHDENASASPRDALEPFDGEELARRVEEARVRVRASVPDMDEQTLVTILTSLLRPFGSGKRFLLKRRRDGGFVF